MGAETPVGEHERSRADTPPIEASGVAPLASFLGSLLRRQVSLGDADAGVIWLYPTPTRQAGPVAIHQDPERSLSRAWVRTVVQAMERNADSLQSPGEEGRLGFRIEQVRLDGEDGVYRSGAGHLLAIVPLMAAGTVEGLCGLVIAGNDRRLASEAALRASLSATSFEAYLWQENAIKEAEGRARLRETLELLDAAIQGQTVGAVAAILCHELRRRFACVRASIGLVHGEALRLVGMSGVDAVDRRAPAVHAIEAAMEECAAQDIEIAFPQSETAERDPATRRVVRAHEQLSLKAGPSAILSLPLRIEGDLVGVVSLERSPEDPFPPGAASLLRLLAEFIGPCIWTRRLADRGILAVARDRILDLGTAIAGPRHTGAKLIGLLLLAIFIALAAIPIPDRVSANAEVRAVTARTIPPPFTGYLVETLVRPGDRVEAGAVLGRMDTSEIVLQLEEELGRRASLETERDNAHATGDLGAWRRASKGVEESDAKIALFNTYIARAEIRSPIAGQVSRGDLEEFVGARVEPTTALFEIVTPDRMVLIEIDERDIRRVEIGQEGWIITTSSPNDRVPIRVARINPSAEPTEGANVFLVEAEVESHAAMLRPGMRGRVKLKDGVTTGLAALARPVLDEIRMRLWW